MRIRALSWIVLLGMTLAPIGARAVFNPEEENPGNYNKVQDDKDRQLREAQYSLMKREKAQVELARQAASQANSQERTNTSGQQDSGVDWATVNRWLFNLSMLAGIGLLAWYGWRHNMPRAE